MFDVLEFLQEKEMSGATREQLGKNEKMLSELSKFLGYKEKFY